jgi:hypothetical protein
MTHGILVIVWYQRTSSKAAGYIIADCTFTCMCWNYQYFVEACAVKVITFVSKMQLASCYSYGYLVIEDNVLLSISFQMVPDEFF